MKNKKVCVVGLGYIGLPTAALLASMNYDVVGVDINESIVNSINNGKTHIVEPGLDELVKNVVATGKLRAFGQQQTADIYLICVPTPFIGEKDHTPNLDYVFSAVREISSYLKEGDLIIIESTSPVGTTEEVYSLLISEGIAETSINIAYCPERVLPGRVLQELVENDRIVGGITEQCTKMAMEFYRSFVQGEVLATNSKTAELCKLSENAFRDVNISLANELSLICHEESIDVWELIQLANRHPRVKILQPGVGVGGHCIAVDPWFIVSKSPSISKVIRTAREVNINKAKWVTDRLISEVEKISSLLGRKAKVACLGLAFKPDIDDLRESPSLQIALTLDSLGYDVVAVEPNIQTFADLSIVKLDDALKTADLIAILVKHQEFTTDTFKKQLNKCTVIDFCGAISATSAKTNI